MAESKKEIILHGIGASPGICIGKAYLVDQEGVDVVKKFTIPTENIADEIKRFKSAVKRAKDELSEIIDNTPEDLRDHVNILETQEILLKDKMLYGRTLEIIENDQVNAEWALKVVVARVKSMFQSMTDAYLRERSEDIVHASDRIMRHLIGAEQVSIGKINKRVVLVAHDLSPAETSQIHLERIKGLITDRGGKASHTGIIARTLEIPAVLGLGRATSVIENDDLLVVDGTTGTVIVHPTEETLLDCADRKSRFESYHLEIKRTSHLPAETLDGFQLRVMANIELPEEVVSAIDYGGDGIGLYRTEFQYLSRRGFPGENELFDKYRDVVEVMAPKPVTIRTLDINGDKSLLNGNACNETNPALGLRAIRYCLHRPDVFITQLRAILRAAAYGHVRVLFPMIATWYELRETRKILRKAMRSLEKDRAVFNPEIEVGIMIEVPSAVIMADVLADEVDFFSIGTNDLIQYSLAIDRGNRLVSYLYQPLDPGLLRMVKHVTDVARDKGIETYMCGEMAGDPLHTPILIGMHLEELSMNPRSIPFVKKMIRALSVSDTQELVREAIKMPTSIRIEKMLVDAYGDLLSENH